MADPRSQTAVGTVRSMLDCPRVLGSALVSLVDYRSMLIPHKALGYGHNVLSTTRFGENTEHGEIRLVPFSCSSHQMPHRAITDSP